MEEIVLTAIVFQGAGALGAYECGVVKELYTSRQKTNPNFKPAVITGISSGAINAAILGSSGIETLEKVWLEDFALMVNGQRTPFWTFPENLVNYTPPLIQDAYNNMVKMFDPVLTIVEPTYQRFLPPFAQQLVGLWGNESMFRVRPEYFYEGPAAFLTTTSFYDTTPLRETLSKRVNFEELNKGCAVVVTAVNVETGEPAYFGNTPSLEDARKCNEAKEFANIKELTVDHILASGSLPPSFPATQVEGNYHYDGGLYLNTPLRVAINCLKRLKRNMQKANPNQQIKLEIIVAEVFPMQGNLPTNIPDTVYRASDIIFSSKLELDDKLFRKFNSVVDLSEDVHQLVELANRLATSYDALSEEVKKNLQIAGFEEKVQKLRDELNDVKEHTELAELEEYQKIDYFTRVPFCVSHDLKNPTDFSLATIKKRIAAGAKEAHQQGIDQPKPV